MTLSDAEKSDVSAVPSAGSAPAVEVAVAVTDDAAAAEPSISAAGKDPTATKKRGREPSSDEAADAAADEMASAGKSDANAAADDDAETEEDKEATKRARASSPPPKKKGARQPKKPQGTSDEKAENPKKRKAPATKKGKKDAEAPAPADEGEETESEPEKQPKKRAKPAAAKEKKSPARKKKPVKEVVESSDSEDEQQQEVLRRVDALDPEVKAKFGSIVWAKMVGFPFWPALITDPRLLPSRLQASAMKDLETKYLVYFYSTKNFAPTLFKNIAPWDDTKNDYRSGFPAKDSKAPKRRAQLMEAIAEADKDLLLPIEERVNGLLKPSVEEPAAKKPAREDGAGSKRGKQLVYMARKSGPNILKAATEGKMARKTNAGKEAEDDEETADEPSQESHEEDDENPVARTLSKDEIKAKVASRKTPSKKKVAGDDAETKAKAGGAAKKASGGAGKSSGKSSDDIDTKRKKEIELMVPRKSVKSADIREMTEEAAKKALPGGAKDKAKNDKGNYKVGDLTSFASKLTRLHLNESAKNNDEIIRMLTQLFEEKLVYRSDVERSGIASIIARLRKSSNPTVAQTASAVRKHMIVIIVDDTGTDGDKSAAGAPKAGASETDSKAKKQKEPKTSEKKSEVKSEPKPKSEPVATTVQKGADGAKKTKSAAQDSAVKKESAAASDEKSSAETLESVAAAAAAADATGDKASGVAAKPESEGASTAASDVTPSKSAEAVATEKTDSEDAKKTATTNQETGSSAAPAAEKRDSSVKKADASLDPHRQAFIDMLSNVLDPSGATHVNVAKEIEEFVFDRYKESNDDYRVQARKITFGLKKNTNLRERLISGALHGLELVYADDKFFEASP